MPSRSDHRSPCDGRANDSQESGSSIIISSGSSEGDMKPSIQYIEYEEDLSPSTAMVPRSSVDTYASTDLSEDDLALERQDECLARDREDDYIPPLPSYHHEIAEPNVRASTSKDFAQLFPSMNRLSIRHDDFTTDGNMNLRVDTIVPGRRRTAVQLFHLRMYDLTRREFSLRRYCRDSGREVCSSKRRYDDEAPSGRPTLQRSMSTAMKNLARPHMRRHNSSGSSVSNNSNNNNNNSRDRRPVTAHSDTSSSADAVSLHSRASSGDHHYHRPGQQPRPTNAVKLEFSNYARVDVARKGSRRSTRYEFEWWGHRYAWRRVVEKQLDGVVSFHLIRDGEPNPVAHIVPETQSPSQIEADERAGGWVPPCFMWINDNDVLDAATDVADVIMASGLVALVDDCIRERWQSKKPRASGLGDTDPAGPRTFMQKVFSQRRASSEHNHHSPLRYPISAY